MNLYLGTSVKTNFKLRLILNKTHDEDRVVHSSKDLIWTDGKPCQNTIDFTLNLTGQFTQTWNRLQKTEIPNSPPHLIRADSSLPSPDKRRVRQQGNGVEGSCGKVRSYWADDDKDHSFPCTRHAEGRLGEGWGRTGRGWVSMRDSNHIYVGLLMLKLTSVPMKVGLM